MELPELADQQELTDNSSARTYRQQLSMDRGCSLEDLDDRDVRRERERERESEKFTQAGQLNDDDPIYQPLRSGRIWHKVNFLSGV